MVSSNTESAGNQFMSVTTPVALASIVRMSLLQDVLRMNYLERSLCTEDKPNM